MIYTNIHNLPSFVCNAIMNDKYDHKPGTFSATGCIKPLRQTVLEIIFDKQIIVDVSDLLYMAQGSSYHEFLLQPEYHHPKTILEERSDCVINGHTLRGKPDIQQWDPDKKTFTLGDLKQTTVWNIDTGTRIPEFTLQLSIYNFILHMAHQERKIENHGNLFISPRDWKIRNRRTQPIAFTKLRVLLLSIPQCREFLVAQLDKMQEAVTLCQYKSQDEINNLLPLCPDRDWGGKDFRCKEYCSVNRFCKLGRQFAKPVTKDMIIKIT